MLSISIIIFLAFKEHLLIIIFFFKIILLTIFCMTTNFSLWYLFLVEHLLEFLAENCLSTMFNQWKHLEVAVSNCCKHI